MMNHARVLHILQKKRMSKKIVAAYSRSTCALRRLPQNIYFANDVHVSLKIHRVVHPPTKNFFFQYTDRAEIRTRIARFRVWSANRYTTQSWESRSSREDERKKQIFMTKNRRCSHPAAHSEPTNGVLRKDCSAVPKGTLHTQQTRNPLFPFPF